MIGLYAAVTRKGKSGAVYGAEEAIPMVRALEAYTRGGAYVTREERRKGTIEAGKLADVIVLSADLLTIPPEQILSTTVDYRAGRSRGVRARAVTAACSDSVAVHVGLSHTPNAARKSYPLAPKVAMRNIMRFALAFLGASSSPRPRARRKE